MAPKSTSSPDPDTRTPFQKFDDLAHRVLSYRKPPAKQTAPAKAKRKKSRR
jgi:hypothetical protein